MAGVLLSKRLELMSMRLLLIAPLLHAVVTAQGVHRFQRRHIDDLGYPVAQPGKRGGVHHGCGDDGAAVRPRQVARRTGIGQHADPPATMKGFASCRIDAVVGHVTGDQQGVDASSQQDLAQPGAGKGRGQMLDDGRFVSRRRQPGNRRGAGRSFGEERGAGRSMMQHMDDRDALAVRPGPQSPGRAAGGGLVGQCQRAFPVFVLIVDQHDRGFFGDQPGAGVQGRRNAGNLANGAGVHTLTLPERPALRAAWVCPS
jgi:hypothetical protein